MAAMGDGDRITHHIAETRGQIAWKTVALVAISVAVRVAFLKLRPWNAVSVDTKMWFTVGHGFLNGENAYATTHVINWPPVWPIMLYAMAAIEKKTGIWFGTLLFSTLLAIEQLVLIATSVLVRRCAPLGNWFYAVLIGLALNPIAIFQTTQHGNFDVMLSLCFVLALLAIMRHGERGDAMDWIYACLFIGLAAACKQVGWVLAPLLMNGARHVPRRTWPLGAGLAFGPALFGIATIYIFSPAGVWEHVIRYRSISGFFGISGFLLSYGGEEAVAMYGKIFTVLLVAVMLGLALHLYRRAPLAPRQLLLVAILLLVGVTTLGPGWGLQYIYWWLPMAIAAYMAIADRFWRGLLLFTYAVMAVTYILQYGANPELGGFVLKNHPTIPIFAAIRENWLDTVGQTLLRLPIFFCCILILCTAIRLLRKQPLGTSSAKPS